jgi:heme-degrading monooxygenase HmoA
MVVVLFHINVRADADKAEYERASERMVELVSSMPGFLGVEGFAAADGSELAVARFESEKAVRDWKAHPEHVRTQERGRTEFFASYDITVAQVIRHYSWSAATDDAATAAASG